MDKKIFDELNTVDVGSHIEQKNKMKYLSWTWAISEITKRYPDFSYEIERFGEKQLPYVYDELTGYMVFTKVTILGTTKEMWLPVMDSSNNAMLSHEYSYKVKKNAWNNQTRKYEFNGDYEERVVAACTMFDINKTIMRCLVKNIAMFGLGLYIYAGEDLPEETTNPDVQEQLEAVAKPKKATKKTSPEPSAPKEEINMKILTPDEFAIIKSNPELIAHMKMCCGAHKYQDYTEYDQIQIAEIMREKIQQLRGNENDSK